MRPNSEGSRFVAFFQLRTVLYLFCTRDHKRGSRCPVLENTETRCGSVHRNRAIYYKNFKITKSDLREVIPKRTGWSQREKEGVRIEHYDTHKKSCTYTKR